MTMAVGQEAPVLDVAEEVVEEEAPEKDPAEERFAKLEAKLSEVMAQSQRAESQLGSLGQYLTQLASQPHTAATDAKIERLSKDLEDLRLRGMDSDEQAAYLLKQREEAAKPRPVEPAPRGGSPPSDPYQEHYGPILTEMAVEAGLDLEKAATRADWPKILDMSKPHPYLDFYKKAKKSLENAADENERAKNPPVRADSTRGGSARTGGIENYRKALRQGGPLPSDEEIDRLTAKYR